ncbi:MAG: Y-family DNA polymerase [Bacteroidia bacterium]
MFALVDCNNFYASCERVFRPDLNGKPIVVLSNNDGCVIARSNEAKAFGVPMGAVAYQYEEIFTKNNIQVFSSNYALYGDMSARVMNLLSQFAPEIEVYSIDEAFLQFDKCDYLKLDEEALKIKRVVSKSTGIPISLGFAPTKTLAKAANRIAKKFPERTNGIYIIDTDEKRIKALKWLSIEDVWGIGRRLSQRLRNIGVKTAFDFTQLNDDWVKKKMSIVELRLKHELEGKPTLSMLVTGAPKQNIATTRSFDHNYKELSVLQERVSTFASVCGEKLRKQKSCCNAIMIFLHTNGHRKDLPQYSQNIIVKTPFPTNSSIEIAEFALAGLAKIYKDNYYYKKAGVVVMDITPENKKQFSLFENSNPKHALLMSAMDKLNRRIGNQKVKLARHDLGRTWKMKQERLSPRFSTNIKEIITVFST